MHTPSPDFYPVHVHEARYGVYARGPWVLLGGPQNPRTECVTSGSDAPCLRFRERVRRDGPVVQATGGEERREPYATAGPNPASSVDVLVDASAEYRIEVDDPRRGFEEPDR